MFGYACLCVLTHWRMTVSIQEELHSGTLRQARALALMMKSFTLSLIFWAFTSCREEARLIKRCRKQLSITFPVFHFVKRLFKTHSIEFFPKLQHLVHVDIYRQIIVGDGLLGLHQPLSDNLQKRRIYALQLWSIIHRRQEYGALVEPVLINVPALVFRAKCGSTGQR